MAPKSGVYNLPVFNFSRVDQTVRQLGTAQESVEKYTKVNLREYLPELWDGLKFCPMSGVTTSVLGSAQLVLQQNSSSSRVGTTGP